MTGSNSHPTRRITFYAAPALIAGILACSSAPALADTPTGPSETTIPLVEQLAILEEAAPAPKPIPLEELPLTEADKSSMSGAQRALQSAAAADVWCGSWLSDPGAVSLTSTRSPISTAARYDFAVNPGGLLGHWQVNDGKAVANGVTYGWSKAYSDLSPTSAAPAERITTGWWDTASSPHFCGWGDSQYRSVESTSTSYTAGVRQAEATYIRAHGYVDGGWYYDTRVAY